MPDVDVATAALPAMPSVPFVPEPLPASTFADLKATLGVFPLKFPVVFEGRTWTAIHLRVFTVAQVATVIRNYERRLKVEPDAVFSFPVYVDEDGNDVPEGVIQQILQDDSDDLRVRASDFLPRRFRPTTAATPPIPDESLSASAPSSGEPTAASS